MGSALESCKGKRLLAKMGDQVFEMIPSIHVPFKIDGHPDSFFRVCRHKKNNKKYWFWLLQDKVGKFCEKKEEIWTCISAHCMVRGVVAGMLLNLRPRKPSFVLCTHTGLGCTLPVGLLPCVASLGFST